MNRSQSQYVIEATNRCKTHREGERILYTGPKSGICAGWKVIEKRVIPQHELCGLVR